MASKITAVLDNIQRVIYVDRVKLEYLVASLIAGGHVILADSHGVGKTSLAKALAQSIRWPATSVAARGTKKSDAVATESFNRVQCTVDLLPQDILGYSKIENGSFELSFKPGPIFSSFLLCDEINLLPPKTQGSFFQAMEEKHVTVEGATYPLPQLFFIIATMNLKGSHLFPLPLPQLDRFMLQLSLGFPSVEDECEIVRRHGQTDSWKGFGPVADLADVLEWTALVDQRQLHPDVLAYIVSLVRATRTHADLESGASPRSGVRISRLARALSIVRGEDYASIDTIKELAVPTLAHRVQARDASASTEDIIRSILKTLKVDPALREILKKR